MRGRGWIRGFRRRWYRLKLARRRFTALAAVSLLAVASLIALVVISTVFRDWVTGGESGSTTIRNIGLVAGGVIALWLAFWRSRVAELQAATAQRALSNQLYQQGAEMLNSAELSVRLDGIYTLERLAQDEPERYHIQIMSRLCAFVRHPTKDDGGAAKPNEKDQLREDVQAVMTAIGTRGEAGIALEKKAGFFLNLHAAALSGVFLLEANLSEALLFGADLSRAVLMGANLSEAKLSGAKLMSADLSIVDFSEAVLMRANISGALLSDARNLTQVQLNAACADVGQPPQVVDIVDDRTGKPLVWHHRPCEGAED